MCHSCFRSSLTNETSSIINDFKISIFHRIVKISQRLKRNAVPCHLNCQSQVINFWKLPSFKIDGTRHDAPKVFNRVEVWTSTSPLQNPHFVSSEPVPSVHGSMDWSIILLINPTSSANFSCLGKQCVFKNVSEALRVRVEISANGSTSLIPNPFQNINEAPPMKYWVKYHRLSLNRDQLPCRPSEKYSGSFLKSCQ